MEIVTPLAGVWIEIVMLDVEVRNTEVTPLAGVWIEIKSCNIITPTNLVTPLAGVWIEIPILCVIKSLSGSHSPCGSVD